MSMKRSTTELIALCGRIIPQPSKFPSTLMPKENALYRAQQRGAESFVINRERVDLETTRDRLKQIAGESFQNTPLLTALRGEGTFEQLARIGDISRQVSHIETLLKQSPFIKKLLPGTLPDDRTCALYIIALHDLLTDIS